MLRGTSSIKSTTSNNLYPSPSTVSEPRHLVRRLLFPDLDPAAPVPPIWKGDDQQLRDLNDEVYLFIALALRAFVQPWYSKITPRDKAFLPRITAILTHLIQTLTTRLLPPPDGSSRHSPLLPLLLLHLPLILKHHIRTYCVASSLPQPRPASAVATFEALQPHVGVLPRVGMIGGGINPLYLGQVVEGIMRVGLEEEDWESELERSVVREVVVRLVLGGVLRKIGEGWFWWEIGLGLCGVRKKRGDDADEGLMEEKDARPPSPPTSTPFASSSPSKHHRFSPTPFLLSLLNFLQTLLSLAILLLSHLSNLRRLIRSSPPAPYPNVLEPWIDLFGELLQVEGEGSRLGGRIVWWWVRGGAGVVGLAGGDRLIPHLLISALSPQTTTFLVRRIRIIMFPKGFPVPSPPDPTLEEQAAMRVHLETLLLEKIPSPLRPLLPSFTSASTLLDPFADAQMNAHLLINVLDAVVATVLPELLVGGAGGGLGGWREGVDERR